MLFNDKKRALSRAAIGGLVGTAVLIPVGGLFNDLVNGGLIATGPHTPFRMVSYDLEVLVGAAPLALAIQIVLYFLMGAVVGIATLPFADGGRELVLRSLAHFAAIAGLLTLTCTLLGWAWSWQAMAVYLVLLAAVYALIWLGRWVGWYAEVAAIREKLGLTPGPSPLKWKESLPYLPFALLLCLALPLCAAAVRRGGCAGPLRPALSLSAAAGGRLLFRPVPGAAAGLRPLYPLLCCRLYPALYPPGPAGVQHGGRPPARHRPCFSSAGERDWRGSAAEKGDKTMKREIKLYNVLFPIWILYFFPQVWIVTVPGNLLIDCGLLLLTLAVLKHTEKRAVLKALWWKFWLLGFLADFIGAAVLFGIWLLLSVLDLSGGAWSEIMMAYLANPFRSLPALLLTLAGVVLAGVCIYVFDKRAMRRCALLTLREKRAVALVMAITTAPWTFLIPLYLY